MDVLVRFYRSKKGLKVEVLPDLQGALVGIDAKNWSHEGYGRRLFLS